MERNFNDFENFLKESADQHRMYPSQKVWNGIYSSLHTRRKWFGLGIVLLLITGSLVTVLIAKSPKQVTTLQKPDIQQSPVERNRVGSAGEASHKDISGVAPLGTSVSLFRESGVTLPTRDLVTTAAIVPAFTASGRPIAVSSLLRRVPSGLLASGTTLQNEFVLFPGIPGLDLPRDISVTDELTDQDTYVMDPFLQTAAHPKPWQPSAKSPAYDWTIESVINSFVRARNMRRFSLQFNMTPTISYRKLSANKSFLARAANVPASFAPLYDINDAVTHKPDLGLEFGLTSKYSLSSRFRIKGGLQFNINRYSIKAFNSTFEAAKIDLRGSRGVDSFYAMSTHRNFSGYKSDWLHNFYFEISMPVGAELTLVGDDRVQFGVAGTIQPTYVLGDRAYLLSSDYKNYAEVPWLIRRWNVNAGFETFVSYGTGRVKWQVGPQVRYQMLSSFVSQYPVKENLFDFGLKVGVSLTK